MDERERATLEFIERWGWGAENEVNAEFRAALEKWRKTLNKIEHAGRLDPDLKGNDGRWLILI
jgi:hypothetical protein